MTESESTSLMREQARVFRRRHWVRNELVPGLVGLGVFWGWMLLFGRGIDWLENNTSYDPLGWLRTTLGDTPAFIVVMLTVGPIGTLVWVTCLAGWCVGWLTRRRIAWYRDTPACVHCDYDLSAVEEDRVGLRLCPECGRTVVPLRARPHAWHGVMPEPE